MSVSNHLVTKFEWQLDGSFAVQEPLPRISPVFPLKNNKKTELTLFFLNSYQDGNQSRFRNNYENDFPNGSNIMSIGVILKAKNQPYKIFSIKMWLKCKDHNEREIHNKEFSVGKRFSSVDAKWEAQLPVGTQNSIRNSFNYNRHTVTLCCEITDLNAIQFKSQSDPNIAFRNQLYALHIEGLENEVTIQVQGREFKVSRNILISQSDVFKTALTNPNFTEAQRNLIQIEDFKWETIQAFIQWLYLGKVDNLSSFADELFSVADKYGVKLLKDECAEELADSLNDNNLASRFILAILHSHDQLKEYIVDFISQKPPNEIVRFFMSPTWMNFLRNHDHLADNVMRMFESSMS